MKYLTALCGEYAIDIQVRDNVDLDSEFTAWDVDTESQIKIRGWMCEFESRERDERDG